MSVTERGVYWLCVFLDSCEGLLRDIRWAFEVVLLTDGRHPRVPVGILIESGKVR